MVKIKFRLKYNLKLSRCDSSVNCRLAALMAGTRATQVASQAGLPRLLFSRTNGRVLTLFRKRSLSDLSATFLDFRFLFLFSFFKGSEGYSKCS